MVLRDTPRIWAVWGAVNLQIICKSSSAGRNFKLWVTYTFSVQDYHFYSLEQRRCIWQSLKNVTDSLTNSHASSTSASKPFISSVATRSLWTSSNDTRKYQQPLVVTCRYVLQGSQLPTNSLWAAKHYCFFHHRINTLKFTEQKLISVMQYILVGTNFGGI